MRALAHFKTITHHRHLVCRYCFRLGLYRQGLLHDLSKYAPCEFWRGAKYYQGYRSPNDAERKQNGVSLAWLHHKGRNKHHYEYWIDYSMQALPGGMAPVPMPDRYIAEMIMDRIAASKVYMGDKYTDRSPLDYYYRGTDKAPIHPKTKAKLLYVLEMLAEQGEEKTFQFIKEELVQHKRCMDWHQLEKAE